MSWTRADWRTHKHTGRSVGQKLRRLRLQYRQLGTISLRHTGGEERKGEGEGGKEWKGKREGKGVGNVREGKEVKVKKRWRGEKSNGRWKERKKRSEERKGKTGRSGVKESTRTGQELRENEKDRNGNERWEKERCGKERKGRESWRGKAEDRKEKRRGEESR